MKFYEKFPLAGWHLDMFKYFDMAKHWNSGIKQIFESDVIQEQLFEDFSKFARAKMAHFDRNSSYYKSQENLTISYFKSVKPIRWDWSDWRSRRVGRPYSFDEYVCYGACHHIVNALLRTAKIAYPDVPWIIVRGTRHSTVWDQRLTFFDMNYYALKVSPAECAIETIFDRGCMFLEKDELLALNYH